MSKPSGVTRRAFLGRSIAASAALYAPWFVPARVLGREGEVAPSEKITLGVIGIGPRCIYDLRSMLALPDVHCVAIADVQASRRDAGKAMVDKHYGNKDCVVLRDFRELLDRKDIDAVLIARRRVTPFSSASGASAARLPSHPLWVGIITCSLAM